MILRYSFFLIDKYQIYIIKNQIISSLSDKIAEGNIFKTALVLSRLKKQGVIFYGELSRFSDKVEILFKTEEISSNNFFKNITCAKIGNEAIFLKNKNGYFIVIITIST